jgi:DNA segregation ATPase FtsK/SpoIIIE-like protein
LRAQARELIVQLQEPSVALLQRHFKLEYDSALQLMQSLEGDIVTAPNAEGWRQMLTTPHLP